jgi:REP element-mobilizing transposase RayT
MPRRPRIKLAGMPQHIVQRGINREPCFFAEEDYHSYLHWLQKAAADWHCAIHAYVLMTNHVQLLVTPRDRGRNGQTHAGHWQALRAIHQPQLPSYRKPVGRTLQIQPDPGRDLPAYLHALHRTSTPFVPPWCKTPANTAGAATGTRPWPGRPTHHPASALPRARLERYRPANRLPGAIPQRAG